MIEARALVDKSGSTDLEISTGKLDSGSPVDGSNIDKLQLKTFDASGGLVAVQNYNGLNNRGYLDYVYRGMPRGQSLQTQVNVSGVDPRVDVVTSQFQVMYRPDLSPTALSGPARAHIHTDVSLSATVSELQGDTGASANCVLSVDGSAVDAVRAMWVDAGGTVTCHFQHRFDTLGTHSLRVDVAGVVPRDYDASNNSVSGSIEIFANEQQFRYWSYAQDINFSSEQTQDFYYNGATTPTDHRHSTQAGWQRWFSLWGYMPQGMQWPLKSFTFTDSTDGQQIGALNLTNAQSYTSNWNNRSGSGSQGCLWSFDRASYRWLSMCSYSWNNGSNSYGWSWLNAWTGAGDVTYHSDGYCASNGWWWGWGGCGYGNWTFNYDNHNTYGVQKRIGKTYDVNISFTDATGATYGASPHIEMQPVNYNYDSGYQCYGNWWWWWGNNGNFCNNYKYSQQGVRGSASHWY